jgi:uncharacterized circularly permuted ATP-grasp superfamily protein
VSGPGRAGDADAAGPDDDLDRAWDEHLDLHGAPRALYAELLDTLQGLDLERLGAAVNAALSAKGVSFGERPFVVDPVPRLLDAVEWEHLSTGLAQRARALNAFLSDAYGAQRIVAAGLLSQATIEQAEGFEPDLSGRLPSYCAPAAIIGFDVVRDPAGEFLVLEDNMRTPSGFCYALAAREALLAVLPGVGPDPRPVDPITYELLDDALRCAAPPGATDPVIVVLTDGPGNVAHYEHATAARRLHCPLLTPEALQVVDGRVSARLPDGATTPVDVVYRRTNEDRVRDEDGRLTGVAELLLKPWLTGRLGIVNAFGNGLADDKLVHAHVEDFIRFYLGEEPVVRSVPTHTLAAPGDRAQTIANLRERVVKPRFGSGGQGVVIGMQAQPAELKRVARALTDEPERYISQRLVQLSRHPTVVEGRLQARHVDLRPFAFCGTDVALAPGGLTRVALQAGALVVNSSQNGGGKDTWVVD